MSRGTITAWMWVHRWSSLVCTAFLLMLCVTGLPLIFHEEIDGWIDPPAPLPAVAVGTTIPTIDTLVSRALAGHPGDVPLYLSFDEDRPVVNVTSGPATDAPPAAMRFDSFDCRTADLLAPRGTGVLALVLRLHTDLFLGSAAEYLLGVMGALFVVALVSGTALYAPFMARLPFGTVRVGRSAAVSRLDRHNLLGIVTLAWASVVGLTGTVNTLVGPVTDMWKADGLAAIERPGRLPAGANVSIDRAMTTARRAAPGMGVQFIAFPGTAYSTRRHYAVYLQGTTPLTRRLLTPVFVDAHDARLVTIRQMPWYMKALLLAQPLHFGDYAGLPLKLLWAVLDGATIMVLVTGLRLWFDRGRGKGRVVATPASRPA